MYELIIKQSNICNRRGNQFTLRIYGKFLELANNKFVKSEKTGSGIFRHQSFQDFSMLISILVPNFIVSLQHLTYIKPKIKQPMREQRLLPPVVRTGCVLVNM